MKQPATKQPQPQSSRPASVTSASELTPMGGESLHPALGLQQRFGNQMVQKMLKRNQASPLAPAAARQRIQRDPTSISESYTDSLTGDDTVSLPDLDSGGSLPLTELADQVTDANAEPKSVEELINGELAEHSAIKSINKHVEILEGFKKAIDAEREGESLRRQWQFLEDTELFGLYREGDRMQHDIMVAVINMIRTEIDVLPNYDFGEHASRVAEIQGYYHRYLNTITPYFTQMANLDILFKGGWGSTCNVTSLSMSLNALGIDQDNFAPGTPRDVLVKIAVLREGQIEQKFEVDTFDKLAALRMPDFLQFVVIYSRYIANGGSDGTEADFERRINTARSEMVSGKRLLTQSIEWFADVAALMGAERRATGQIGNGDELAVYRRNVEEQITPHLNAGGQIVVNKPGHYVRLQNISEEGIAYDDPYSTGKSSTKSWSKAHADGYFRSYQVFYKA